MSAQKTILCIEDEDDLRGDLAEELVAADYRVLQAANGSEALAVLEQNRPDLVLCDITMPGLGGYDVLRAMREQGELADVPFIFLTALADRNDVLVGKQAGADDYLVKPIDYEILLATIAARLNQVERVKSGAVQRAEEAWQAILNSSRGRTIDALYKATFAFDRFLVGVVIVDVNGIVKIMNKEAERILGENDGLGVSQDVIRGACRSRIPSCTRASKRPSSGNSRTRSCPSRDCPGAGRILSSSLGSGSRPERNRRRSYCSSSTRSSAPGFGRYARASLQPDALRDPCGPHAQRRQATRSDRRGTGSGSNHRGLPSEERNLCI